MRENPEDFIGYTKLSGYYLQRQRETGSDSDLALAESAARAALAVVPAERNYGGLAALAQVELSQHQFTAAHDHAHQLIALEPKKSLGFQILSDALIELGQYEAAEQALARMRQLAGASAATETRLGKYALLRGRTQEATQYFVAALVAALAQLPPSRETVAWSRWQLGEVAFSVGDYATAERHYADALTTFPDYRHALAGLGRVRFAHNDLPGAISYYERALAQGVEEPTLAALGDLYQLAGRTQDAAAQYAQIEQMAQSDQEQGIDHHRRQLALFYADHDLQPKLAYRLAVADAAARPSIYAADAVAWTALKAGKLAEARAAIQEALKLGTQDAKLYYHAGMIAKAAGLKSLACAALNYASELSPSFDPLQAEVARRALVELHRE